MNEFYNKMKFIEKTEGIKREVYYHYTSIDALYSIIQNQTFWLTSLRSSNDKKELVYKPISFIDDISAVIGKETDESTRQFFSLLQNSLNEHRDAFIGVAQETKQPFSLCLSTKADNLTHWDRYANGCTGVSIGVNVAALKVYYSRMNSDIFGGALLDIGKVIYDCERERYLRNCMVNMFKLIQEMNKRSNNEGLKETIANNGFMVLAAIYQHVSIFLKTAAFADESEARIYYDANSINSTLHLIDAIKSDLCPEPYNNLRANFLEITTSFGIDSPHFAIFSKGIREYRTLCLKSIWGSALIPEIFIGPLCPQSIAELKKFVTYCGLEGTKIIRSKVPLR